MFFHELILIEQLISRNTLKFDDCFQFSIANMLMCIVTEDKKVHPNIIPHKKNSGINFSLYPFVWWKIIIHITAASVWVHTYHGYLVVRLIVRNHLDSFIHFNYSINCDNIIWYHDFKLEVFIVSLEPKDTNNWV